MDLFLFYVLCEVDERGYHIVGYFSKEKCSEEGCVFFRRSQIPPPCLPRLGECATFRNIYWRTGNYYVHHKRTVPPEYG